jgi:3-methyl-2-oxobutanoate hydroxymethyltransferase
MKVYVGLGSNLSNPLVQLKRALRQIAQWPNTQITRLSSLYETTAVGPPQPPIWNRVVALETTLSAKVIAEHMQALETLHGRTRTVLHGPRTLDIDLLLYGEDEINTPTLTIPHPRMKERDFVLVPLLEIYHADKTPWEAALKNAPHTLIQTLPLEQETCLMNTQLPDLWKRKKQGKKITALTAYDATFANLISSAGVDVILVGDTLGQVVQGKSSTVPVTLDDMVYHTACVARGNQGAFLIADLPFMTYYTPEQACASAARLMQAGAQMVKIEGGRVLAPIVEALTAWDIPVCVHLGLRPQSVNMQGGYKVQGKNEQSAQQLLEDTQLLEKAGAKLCVLECIPEVLATQITASVQMPVIGIGAGREVDGQILVTFDMLGMIGKTPKFVKNFLDGSGGNISAAIAAYVEAVRQQQFPEKEHCYVYTPSPTLSREVVEGT